MRDVLWIYISVLTVIIGFAIISSLFNHANEVDKSYQLKDIVSKLVAQCNLVCNSLTGTSLPAQVTLFSGIIISSSGDKICATFDEGKECVKCNCNINEYNFNLNNSLARTLFEKHDYFCYFSKEKDAVSMECKG